MRIRTIWDFSVILTFQHEWIDLCPKIVYFLIRRSNDFSTF